MALTLILCTSLVGLFLIYSLFKKKKKIVGVKAPRVGRYPIVGSFFHTRDPITRTLIEDFPEAPVVEMKVGLQTVYFLNNIESVREAFVEKGDIFLGRQDIAAMKKITSGAEGIVMAEGEAWRQYRRFTLKTLRDFGFGRKGAEEIISFEADSLAKIIEGQLGKPMEMSLLMSMTVSNVICQLVFGSRLATEDKDFEKIADIFRSLTQSDDTKVRLYMLSLSTSIFNTFPFLVDVFMRLGPTKSLLEDLTYLKDYCLQHIAEHVKMLDPNAEAKDFIDAHIQHQSVADPEMFTDKRLSMAIRDLFIAGTDTTSHTLRLAFLYMVAYPEVAKKVVEEIGRHIGTSRPPQMSDRAKLHYVNATIEEIHRLASLVPEGLAHRALEDTTVAGFFIENDSLVKANVYGIHFDPNVFPDPHELKPERHLTPEGTFRPHENVIAFSIGKRACLGESLARMELFLFFTTIMQRFHLEMAPGEKSARTVIEESQNSAGFIRVVSSHKLVFSEKQ